MKKTYLIIFLVAILLAYIGIFMPSQKTHEKKIVNFGVTQIAFSSDPLDYDYLIHHFAFSSVYSKLVSNEKNGEIFPMLASDWKNENNFKTWKFTIRDDLTYSNGDKVSIYDIELNFKRLTFLKRKKNSNSGVLEFLKGFENFDNMDNNLEGIQVKDKVFVLNFVKPMPDLLEKISFGFYGLAHPSLFNNKTGEWINKLKVISSGPYEVTLWNKDQFNLQLRTDVVFHNSENRLNTIRFNIFTNAKNAEDIEKFDLFFADKSSLLVTNQFENISSSEKLKLGYVQVSNAKNSKSPLSKIEIRKWLRFKFYENLEKNKFPIVSSFFPPTLKGLKPMNEKYEWKKPNFQPFSLTSEKFNFSAKIEENKDKKSVTEYYTSAIDAIGENSGINLILENNKDNIYDIKILGSGIEASDYMDTVKFMFLSKEGIRLPDINGKILEELKKESPDINFINQEIWDQAVIWPIRHYSSGYWFNKNSNIDHSEMNFESPSIDFQFLKWK